MTGIFRANNPLNPFLLFIYGLLLKMGWFLHPQIPEIPRDGLFFNNVLLFIKPALDNYPVWYSFIAYLLLFTQAIAFNHFVINGRLFQKPNYLPAMSYLLVTSLFPEWNLLSAPLVINTFIIWIWAKMTTLYTNPNAKSTLFNMGIAIGICSFFFFPALAFTIMVIFALLITRAPKAAEWLVALLGIATTWYFLFGWLFLSNRLYSFKLPDISISYPQFAQNNVEYAIMILIFIVAIIGGYFVQSAASRQIVQVRKSWVLLLLYLIVALFIPFINNNKNFEYWIMATVPISAFMASTFYYPRIKWIPAVFHWVMVGFVFYMQYFK